MDKIEAAQKEQKECADMIAKARELQNQAKDKNSKAVMPNDMVEFFKKHNISMDSSAQKALDNVAGLEKQIANHKKTLLL